MPHCVQKAEAMGSELLRGRLPLLLRYLELPVCYMAMSTAGQVFPLSCPTCPPSLATLPRHTLGSVFIQSPGCPSIQLSKLSRGSIPRLREGVDGKMEKFTI